MPNALFEERTRQLLDGLRHSGQFKELRYLTGPMGPTVRLEGWGEVICLCSNNYLGLACHPEVVAAGRRGLEEYGAGTASVRFICGTLACHREIEQTIAALVGTPRALTYVSCWTANEALIPTVAAEGDLILSDELNHASIIDGCRLARAAERQVYRHADLDDLEQRLRAASNNRARWVITDGVFSMEGDLAHLDKLVEIAAKYNAILFVDDSHAVGVCGKSGRGTPEAKGVHGKIDVLTGTLGKAIGGAAGGYISGKKELIAYMRQKARPYTFSNSLPAPIVYGASAAFDMLMRNRSLVTKLHKNTAYFRREIVKLGYRILEGDHPIVPIMLGEAAVAQDMSNELLKAGVYIKGLWFPVVPRGEARLRAQISAALTKQDLDRALDAFEQVGKRMKVI